MCNERRKSESLLARLASDAVLTQAYRWLCAMREHYHHNDEVCHARYWWARQKPLLQAQFHAGTYRPSKCRLVERSAAWIFRLYEQGAAWGHIGA